MRKIEVHSYDEKWPQMFAEEAVKIKHIFGNEIIEIHHIGSTAVPGLKAKPILDIMPVVKDIKLVDEFNQEMQAIGYVPKGENGLPGRRYFQKGGNNRTHHVHIYQVGSKEIIRHIAFQDYLRENPVDKEIYSELKDKLAKQYPYDIEAYINGKKDVVKVIELQALNWFNGRMKNKSE